MTSLDDVSAGAGRIAFCCKHYTITAKHALGLIAVRCLRDSRDRGLATQACPKIVPGRKLCFDVSKPKMYSPRASGKILRIFSEVKLNEELVWAINLVVKA